MRNLVELLVIGFCVANLLWLVPAWLYGMMCVIGYAVAHGL